MHLLYIILVGFLAGWLARYVLKARKHGVLIDIVLGILGAVAGGFLFGILGLRRRRGAHRRLSSVDEELTRRGVVRRRPPLSGRAAGIPSAPR
jgi:uncharacterized membrane protein YeaQ/YmgE (transglycosylase-associated protein family)